MTYSLAFKGLRADTPSTMTNVTLSDAQGRAGNQMQAMRDGTQFLCKMPDGSERMCVIDTERSIPGGAVYVLPVGP